MSKQPSQNKIEIKNVKHTYSPEERSQIGGDLAREVGALRGVQAEFDQVKASFKARITEKEAKIDALSTNLCNGFDMRNERCVVVFRPKDREKDYFLEGEWNLANEKHNPIPPAVLTEPMTKDDFQQDLIQAESGFDKREEIALFPSTDRDSGIVVVGLLAGKWYSALRIVVGTHKIDERLDSEQKSFKFRADAVKRAGKRALEWLRENLKDNAKGFEEPIAKAVAAHIERVE